jgi:hypothetical protein
MRTLLKSGMLLSGLVPGGQAFAAYSCTAVSSNTGGAFFQMDMTVTNSGTTQVNGWTITPSFPEKCDRDQQAEQHLLL